MRRAIARLQTWWLRLFVLTIGAMFVLPVPFPTDLVVLAVPLLLSLVRPSPSTREPIEVSPPVRGRWVALNSPGSAVPSHGIKAYGQAYAVDLLPPSPSSTPPSRSTWGLRGESPESYPGFGEPVHAMASGTVVRARDGQRDHRTRTTVPLVLWMVTVEGFLRELGGASGLLGNHVIIRHDDGTHAAYAHLHHGSARIRDGEHVTVGQTLALVGNTGNSSEPHLHVQLMDDAHPCAAAGVPMRWPEAVVDPSAHEPRWQTTPRPTAQPGFPANGQIFEVP